MALQIPEDLLDRGILNQRNPKDFRRHSPFVTVHFLGKLGFGGMTGTSSDLRFAPATFPKGEG